MSTSSSIVIWKSCRWAHWCIILRSASCLLILKKSVRAYCAHVDVFTFIFSVQLSAKYYLHFLKSAYWCKYCALYYSCTGFVIASEVVVSLQCTNGFSKFTSFVRWTLVHAANLLVMEFHSLHPSINPSAFSLTYGLFPLYFKTKTGPNFNPKCFCMWGGKLDILDQNFYQC